MTREHEDESLRRLHRALQEHRAAGHTPPPGPGLERVQALVEGRGSEEERLATLDAVMSTPEGAREFELLRALAANRPAGVRAWRLPRLLTPQATNGTRPDIVPAWRRPRVLAPLAAAAVLVLAAVPLVLHYTTMPAPEALRDVSDVPILQSPAQETPAAQAGTFRWSAVSGARAYVLEILTASGQPLFTMHTTSTSATLPADVVIAPGVEYFWWVGAELGDGTQRRSAFRRLLVRQAR